MKRKILVNATTWSLVLLLGAISAVAQANSYQQTNLVSDMAGAAAHTDPKLVNPWGISFVPGQPFWIADNNSGYSTVYDANGVTQLAPVLIPSPPGSPNRGTPTGTVINQTGGFKVADIASQFLFVSEDGTISGWNGGGNAITAIDHSATGAVYKGMAILSPACCAPFMVAANFHTGNIEAYTQNFQPLAPPGNFTDPQLPAGFAPFNIQQVGSFVFVTYAVQDAAKHDPVNAAGNGIVDIFDLEGNFVKRFASHGALNSPWGVVKASADFGQFSNDILIGNFGDGTINAFDADGNAVGQLKDATGATLTNASLWALVFGAGGTGDSNTLYFTAGLANEGHGLFGAIAAAAATTADYSIAPNTANQTVTAGQSANFMLTITAANGFNSLVTLRCTAPNGTTCALNPTTVTPGATAATSQLTVTTSSSVQHYGRLMGLFFAGAGLFGCFLVGAGKPSRGLRSFVLAGLATTLIAGSLLATTGCGGYGSSAANRGTASIVVTATSGAISHTTTVNLTVQ